MAENRSMAARRDTLRTSYCREGWRRVRVTGEAVCRGELILVNQRYPVRPQSGTDDLTFPFPDQPQHRMIRAAAEALRSLLKAVKAQDRIVGVSGFRTQEEQENIWRGCETENGLEYTAKYVAVPGHSEHQTGLAMDVALNRESIDFICPDFPDEGVCKEFRKRAASFGFVERYPAGREHVTGIGAEPWHFRYVGTPHAGLMQEQHMVLEEYVEWLKGFPLRTRPLFCRTEGRDIFIGYVPCPSRQTVCEIALPGSYSYTVSGNNVDGVIVTAWMEH